MPTQPTRAYQAPALDNEPQLLRTLEWVCLQHGATDRITRGLLREVVISIRHATDHQRLTRAHDRDDLAFLTQFAARVLAAHGPDQPDSPPQFANPDDLAPEIRDAIAIVAELIFEREEDDYRQHDEHDRGDHPYRHLALLHGWLGKYSLIR
ncbi:hypothetical protein ABH933_001222 [Nocardia sp. GP40]|uniref:hypothetical protein n=1 Tax=Nocardia sp. GP40 TaxID=3156268 RepID=UPI003D1F5DBD